MNEFIKLTWGSNCTFANTYYGDGYQDFIFIPASKADIAEPQYNIKRNNSTERQGRIISNSVEAKKTIKLNIIATEVLCDVINTIPLADSIILQFPDGTILGDITGDDVELNFGESKYDSFANINYFNVEILILIDVIIKQGCCVSDSTNTIIADNSTLPTIEELSLTTLELNVLGTAPDNYYVRCLYREFANVFSPNEVINSISSITMCSETGGFIIDGMNIYKSIDGFKHLTLVYTADVQLNKIYALSNNIIIAIGNDGQTYRSIDCGVNWSNVITPNSINLYGIYGFIDEVLYLCGGDGIIIMSTDNGATYINESEPNVITTEILRDIHAIKNLNYTYWIIVGDNGTTIRASKAIEVGDWHLTIYEATNYTSVYCYSTNKFYLTTSNGDIIKSATQGATFTILSTGVYTALNAIGLTKYGLLAVGAEFVLIDNFENITTIKESTSNGIKSCVACYNNGTPYKLFYIGIFDTMLLTNDIDFVDGGSVLAVEYINEGINITLPLLNVTYVIKAQTWTYNYTNVYDSIEVITTT